MLCHCLIVSPRDQAGSVQRPPPPPRGGWCGACVGPPGGSQDQGTLAFVPFCGEFFSRASRKGCFLYQQSAFAVDCAGTLYRPAAFLFPQFLCPAIVELQQMPWPVGLIGWCIGPHVLNSPTTRARMMDPRNEISMTWRHVTQEWWHTQKPHEKRIPLDHLYIAQVMPICDLNPLSGTTMWQHH